MLHETAFDLVSQYAPAHAGDLWNTSNHTACDTANAIADQYDSDETEAAIEDLKLLAAGQIPTGWEAAD